MKKMKIALLLSAAVAFTACGNNQVKEEPGLKDALKDKFLIGVALNTVRLPVKTRQQQNRTAAFQCHRCRELHEKW